MASTEMENLIDFLQQMQKTSAVPEVDEMRASLEQLASMITPDKDVATEAVTAAGVAAEWIYDPDASSRRVLLYFHGGGYVAGSLESHRDLLTRLAKATGRRILAPDYRLAPEHPFPAAVEDAVAVYRWLLEEGGSAPSEVAVAGDSAGGGLTLAMLINLRDAGDPLPAAGVCLSPWTDLAVTGASVRERAEADPFVTPEGLRHLSGLYRQGEDARHPLVSPLYGDLSGLPPLLIQVGDRECLLDDSVRLAEKAEADGVDVTLEVWEGMIHVFQSFAAVAPEGVEGIRKIAEYLADR